MYKLKEKYKHSRIATSTGHLVDNSFFNRYAKAKQIIEANKDVLGRYFDGVDMNDPGPDEDAAESNDGGIDYGLYKTSEEYTAAEAKELIAETSKEELEGFVTEDESRKSVIKAYQEKIA